MTSEKSPTLDFVSELARDAGQLTLRFFRKKASYTEKQDHQGIVTEADLGSEQLVISRIKEKFPEHAILAEESGLSSETSDSSETPIWLIDPLDGTANFSHGNPYYCVSIAYGIRQGENCDIRLAAVFHPPTGDLFTAEKGKGAWRNGESISASTLKEFRLGSFCTGFGSNHGESLRRILDQIAAVQSETISTAVRVNGAAALDLAYVAFGVFDGFWEPRLNPWDTAAGSLLVREAGGVITNFKGEEFDPLRDRSLVCGNRELQGQLLKTVV